MLQRIEGKEIAKAIRAEVKEAVSARARAPRLVALAVGEDEASLSYTRNQAKSAAKLGIDYRLDILPVDTPFDGLASALQALAEDDSVDGIMLQMPLPKGLDAAAARELIPVEKDVEAIGSRAAGRLLQGQQLVAPCTAVAALLCIEEACREREGGLSGLDVAIVGRSDIVGKPLALLLLQANATPTVCHTRTRDMNEKLRRADVVVAAVGVAELIKGDMVKDGAIVIDVGINYNDAGKMVGDVAYGELEERPVASGPTTSVPPPDRWRTSPRGFGERRP